MSQSQKPVDAVSWRPLLLLLPLLLVGFSCLPSSESLVVPQEFPSLLSLIYSNIPPIRKGTDSRLGFGFRLGDHADFQILLELGPQKETQPIGDKDGKSSFSKRQVNRKELLKALLRQEQQEKQQQEKQQQLDLQQQNTGESAEHTASSWLQSWSQDMNNENQKKPTKTHNKQKSAQNGKKPVLPTPPAMAEQAFQQLQVLYKMASTTTTKAETTTDVQATTSTTPKPFAGLFNLSPSTSFDFRPDEQQLQNQHFPHERKTKAEITAELMDVNLENER